MEPYTVIAAILAAVSLAMVVRAYVQARDVRVVHCPGGSAQAVRLRGLSSVLGFARRARVSACTAWPQRKGCAQGCLVEVAHARDHCAFLVRLAGWYGQKNCVFCYRAIPPVAWGEPRPALLSPDGRLVTWSEVEPRALDGTLRTHSPVCGRCAGAIPGGQWKGIDSEHHYEWIL